VEPKDDLIWRCGGLHTAPTGSRIEVRSGIPVASETLGPAFDLGHAVAPAALKEFRQRRGEEGGFLQDDLRREMWRLKVALLDQRCQTPVVERAMPRSEQHVVPVGWKAQEEPPLVQEARSLWVKRLMHSFGPPGGPGGLAVSPERLAEACHAFEPCLPVDGIWESIRLADVDRQGIHEPELYRWAGLLFGDLTEGEMGEAMAGLCEAAGSLRILRAAESLHMQVGLGGV